MIRGEGDEHPPEGSGDSSSTSGSTDTRWLEKTRRVLPRLGAGLLVTGALLALAAWFGVGMGAVVPFVLERVAPGGWAVRVGAVEGRWPRHMELSGVSVEGPDLSFSAERILLRYRLTPLLDRTVDIELLEVERPALRVVQDTASSSPADTTDGGPSTLASLLAGEGGGGWAVRLGSVGIVDGLVGIRTSAGTPRYDLSTLRLRGGGALDEGGLTVDVDSLSADFLSVLEAPADSVFRSAGRVALTGSLGGGELTLDTLLLASEESDLGGSGRVAFVPSAMLVGTMDLQIRARPLDLRDLPFRLPEPLLASPVVSAELGASGNPDSVGISVRVERPAGGGELDAEGVLRPRLGSGGEADAPGGDAPPALEGSVRFRAVELGGLAPPPFDGTASGDVAFTLGGFGPAAAYSADGWVRHRPGTVDPSRILTRPLDADFEARGQLPGDSTATPLRADASVEVQVEGPRASRGRVEARVEGTAARWSVDLTLDSGRVEGSGSVDWGGEELTAMVERLRTRRFDLSVVDTVYPASRITGEARGRIRGASPEGMVGQLQLDLTTSSLRDVQVDTLSASSEIRGRTYRGLLMGRTGLGRARTRFVVRLDDSAVRFEVDSLRYTRPDSVADAPPLGEVYGRATGSWRLSDERRATLRATVDSARWSTISIRRGRLDGTLDGERIVAEADVDAAGIVPTPLRLAITADVRGTALPEMEGEARVAAFRAHAGDSARVDSLRVLARAPRPGRFELDGSAHAAGGGALAFTGTAAADTDSIRFDVRADGAAREPVDLLGGASVDSVSIHASGRRVAEVWRDVRSDIDVASLRWRELEARTALASLRYDSTGVRLDTLHVRSNVLEASGGGDLPVAGTDGRLELRARLLDLEPVRALTGLDVLAAADGTFQATAAGSLDSLSWSTEAALEAVVADEIRMTGVRLDGEGVVAAPYDFLFGLASSDVTLTFDRITLPASEIRTVRTELAGGSDSLRVEVDAVVDGRRNAFALVHVDPRPDQKRARIDDLRLQLDQDEWRLVEDAVVEYGAGVSVEPVLLRADEQEIRVEGGVSEDGILDLNARMDSTDVGTVADLAGFPRLRGWLTGRIRVQGPTDALEAWLDASGGFHREGRPPGPVDLRVRANGRRVRGNLRFRDSSSGSLELSGGLLFPGAGAAQTGPTDSGLPADNTILGLATDSIGVTVAAQDFDLRWTEAFFTAEQIASLTGNLDGSLSLTGSSRSPELDGRMGLRNGSARPTALGVRWDAIALSVRGDGSDLVVDTARISASSGRLTARGNIGVRGALPLDLAVTANDFQAIRTDAYWAVVSGELQVGGVALAPEIEGGIRVASLDVFLDERVTSEGLEPVELTEEDLAMLRERFGVVPEDQPLERPFAERITADVEVVLGRDSWLRKRTSPEMAVPFSGTMEVALRPGETPILQGSVDVISGRGFVEQFGRRFELSEGTVSFNGPPDQTRVDLTATYRVPSHDNPDDAEVTIILDVEGTQSDLGLTLSSEPPMENADIVSYIATGRPAAGSLSFQGQDSNGGLVAAGTDFALSQMTSVIESAAARRVGLDVVEIRREGLRQATLVAGKYVSPRVYVGFAQPVSLQEGDGLSFGSEGQSEVEIEYEAFRWLILNLEGSGSSIRFFLRGRRAY